MSVAKREKMIDISRKLVSCLLKSSIKSHSKGSVDSDNWGNLSDEVIGNLVPAPECFVNWLLKPTTAFSQQQSHTVVNANGAKILQVSVSLHFADYSLDFNSSKSSSCLISTSMYGYDSSF